MKAKLLAVGGVASALAASACCIAPLALVSVGVSAARIGNLTALAPYLPIFIALAAIGLGAGFWMVYRPSARVRRTGACAVPRIGRFVMTTPWVKGVHWIGAVLVAQSVGVDHGARLSL